MTSASLENLVRAGHLKEEPPSDEEITGLIASGKARLEDAQRSQLAYESRFDLAYNAAHSLSLAALRRAGYRADRRYVVFQALPHTLGIPASTWRVLSHAHGVRNRTEYEGFLQKDERLLSALLRATDAVVRALEQGEDS